MEKANWLNTREANIIFDAIEQFEPKQIIVHPDDIWDYLSQFEGQEKGPSQDEHKTSTTETD